MPPKRSTRASKNAQGSPRQPLSEPAVSDPPRAEPLQHGGPTPAKKRPTTTDNAKAICAMQTDLASMSGLLTTLTQRLCPDAPAEVHDSPVDLPEADPENYAPVRGRQHGRHQDPHRTWSAPTRDGDHQGRHPSAPPRAASGVRWAPSRDPYHQDMSAMFSEPGTSRSISDVDPLVARPGFRPYRDFPTTLQGLEDDADLQTRVTTLLSAGLVPMAKATGKKSFAHCFIARGTKRSKTTLGDLSIPEYNTGFIRLIHHHDTPAASKPFMFKHLEHVNEDAINYEWADVRGWSEEMCALIAEGKLTWSDEYRLDILRIKLSQDRGITTAASTHSATGHSTGSSGEGKDGDIFYPLSAELRAAKPGPPCRHFNAGSCSHQGDHVTNDYRQLHVCAHCMSAKCLFWPHSDKGCRTKEFAKKRAELVSGFGK